MTYDYIPANNIDFNSIDWVELVNAMGIMPRPKVPVILSVLSDEYRFTKATEYIKFIIAHGKLPKNYLRESLQAEIDKQNMTSLDKAWIVLHVNRMLKDLDFR